MISIARLQSYLRDSAQQRYEAVPAPPFTCFFYPADALTYFNYAIPDRPCGEELAAPLSALRSEFAARGRTPRFEFIEQFASRLGPALCAAGFIEEARQPLMICTAETIRPALRVAGLAIAEVSGASPIGEMQEFLTVQRQGFDPQNTEAVTAGEAESFLRGLGEGRAFMARLDEEPVAVGMVTAPLDGLMELVGLATLEPFRKRGIATALTESIVRSALAQGVQIVLLTAADERAGRVYERVGFAPCATMLAYIDPSSGPRPAAS